MRYEVDLKEKIVWVPKEPTEEYVGMIAAVRKHFRRRGFKIVHPEDKTYTTLDIDTVGTTPAYGTYWAGTGTTITSGTTTIIGDGTTTTSIEYIDPSDVIDKYTP